MAYREAESGPYARRLGREERIEDPTQDTCGDPAAGIPHLHHDLLRQDGGR